MSLSREQVLSLAPDGAAASAGAKLADTRHWQELGRSSAAMWGICQGSTLYQVRVDLGDTSVSCSCPSRKHPCKHGLGLLLLAAERPDTLRVGAPPAWVESWLSKRKQAQNRREARNTGVAESEDPSVASRRAAQSRRTAAARERKVAAGLDTLDLWLDDLMRGGMAGLETSSDRVWEAQAARMVDAQAPGVAARLRAMAALPNATPDWPDRLLAALGRLALLSTAYRSIDTLEPALADDVRFLLGWTIKEDEVAARGEAVADDWLVLSDEIASEDRLRVRRSWLLGAASGRTALVLQYATSKDGFSQSFVAGTHQQATLVLWPGAYPQRAAVRERSGRPGKWQLPLPGAGSIGELLESVAAALGRQPWLDRFACMLGGVVPVLANRRWTVQDASGNALPLAPGEHWALLALSGGAPVDLAGEWDGSALRPLGVVVDGRYRVLPEPQSSVKQGTASLEAGPLATLALAGTARAAGRQPDLEPRLEQVFAGVQLAPERELLLRAAAEAVYGQAGYVAGQAEPALTPAPDEQLGACSPGAAALLQDVFEHKYRRLLPEACRLLARARLRLPNDLLPVALSAPTEPERAELRPVLGERGRWLSRFNQQWAWAAQEPPILGAVAADAERIWQEGSPGARLTAIRRVRAADPALARSWIEAVWRRESVEFLSMLLDVLAMGLGPEDEPLLETALDRATRLRRPAARLLATIPGSALSARMRERADRLLDLQKPAPVGGLRGLVRGVLRGPDAAGVLNVTLPQELPDNWQRDGISAKPPSGTGERTWWLMDTLSFVQPAHWETRWGLGPAQLIALAAGDEGAAVLYGWSRAAALHQASVWAAAFWEAWGAGEARAGPNRVVQAEVLPHLLPALPRSEAEHYVVRAIDRLSYVRSDEILAALPAPWSAAFGRAYIDAMRRIISRPQHSWWDRSLEQASYQLPPECFENALALQNPDVSDRSSHFVKQFRATIERRQRFYRELAS